MSDTTAEKRLREMLRAQHGHRSDLEEFERKGNAEAVDRCRLVIQGDYIGIRRHCEETGLPLPVDVPSE